MWIYFVKGEVLVGYCYRSSTKVLLWVAISKEDGEIKEATREDGEIKGDSIMVGGVTKEVFIPILSRLR